MRFVVAKMAQGYISLRVIQFFLIVVPPMLHTHLHVDVALTRRKTRETWKTSKTNTVS